MALIDQRRAALESFNRATGESDEYRSAAQELADLEGKIEEAEAQAEADPDLAQAQLKAIRIRKRAMASWIAQQVASIFSARNAPGPAPAKDRRSK